MDPEFNNATKPLICDPQTYAFLNGRALETFTKESLATEMGLVIPQDDALIESRWAELKVCQTWIRDNSCITDLDCDSDPDRLCDTRNPEECSRCDYRWNYLTFEGKDVPLLGNETELPGTVVHGVCRCTPAERCSMCSTLNEDPTNEYRNTWGFFRLNNECQQCPDNPELLIAGFCVAVVAACVGGYILNKKNFNVAFISIGVDYAQVLALFANANIAWPKSMLTIFNAMSFFNLNVDIAAPECMTPDITYLHKWYGTMALPVAAFGLLFLFNFFKILWKCIKGKRRDKLFKHTSKLIAIWLLMFYYMYLSLLKRGLDVFNCTPTDPDDGFLYTEFTSVECGGGLCKCGETLQESLKLPAAICISVYSIGWPLWVLFILRTKRALIKEDQLLRAMGIGETREENPNAYDVRKRYHKMYYHFKPGKVYWIMAIISRKFWIAFASLMFRSNTAFQLAFVLMVLFISYVLQVKHRPYMSTSERRAVLDEHESKAKEGGRHKRIEDRLRKIKDDKLAKKLQADKHRRYKKKLEDKKEEKLSREAVKSYFWDYNTVEATMLACAIFVCLSGVMFESGQFQRPDLEYQKEIITWLTLLVLAFSFLYYFTVFVAEVGGSNYCQCFATKKSSHQKMKEADLDRGMSFTSNRSMSQSSDGDDHGFAGINPMVAAKLAQSGGGGGGARSEEDWELIKKELERMQEVNTKMHNEIRDMKKKEAAMGGGMSPAMGRKKKKKKGKKMKEFSSRTLGNKASAEEEAAIGETMGRVSGGKKKKLGLMGKKKKSKSPGKSKKSFEKGIEMQPTTSPKGGREKADSIVVSTATPLATPKRRGTVTKKGDWLEAKDPTTGRSYWHNSKTNESTWTDPTKKADKGGAPKDGDWVEAKDPGSGRLYWHNRKTSESTWTNPYKK